MLWFFYLFLIVFCLFKHFEMSSLCIHMVLLHVWASLSFVLLTLKTVNLNELINCVEVSWNLYFIILIFSHILCIWLKNNEVICVCQWNNLIDLILNGHYYIVGIICWNLSYSKIFIDYTNFIKISKAVCCLKFLHVNKCDINFGSIK